MLRRELIAGLGAASIGMLATAAAEPVQEARNRKRFPNVELKTHTGSTVRFYDDLLRDKVVAINMMYAECKGICPRMTQNLLRVQQLLGERVGKDIFLYSISLRPEVDTAEALAEYVTMHGIKPGWVFLTGTRRDVDVVRYALGFYDPDPAIDKAPERHTGMLRIGNDAFDRWTNAPALADPEQIVSCIRRIDRSARA